MCTFLFEAFRQHFKVVLYKAPHPEQAPDSGPKFSPFETNFADILSMTSRALKEQDQSVPSSPELAGSQDPQVPVQGGFAEV